MSEMIDRDEVIEIIESVCSADDTYWKPGTLEKIRNLSTHPTPSNALETLDLISRQAAIDAVIKRDANCGIDSAEVLKLLPSAQKTGKWAGADGLYGCGIYICDNCGKFAMIKSDFCPNCGSYNGGD